MDRRSIKRWITITTIQHEFGRFIQCSAESDDIIRTGILYNLIIRLTFMQICSLSHHSRPPVSTVRTVRLACYLHHAARPTTSSTRVTVDRRERRVSANCSSMSPRPIVVLRHRSLPELTLYAAHREPSLIWEWSLPVRPRRRELSKFQ